MRLTLPAVLVAIALASTACGGDETTSSAPAATPVHWSAGAATGIRPDQLTDLQGGAGWHNGFVLAGRHTVAASPNSAGRVNDWVGDVYVSPDGTQWHPASLEGLEQVGHRTPVAGHGNAVYVVGATAGGAAVWRSEDGASWTRIPLAGSKRGEALSAVAAGPHGVVVVGFDRPIAGLDTDRITDSRDHSGLRVWHSADGKAFTGPETVGFPGLGPAYLPDVAATAEGFTLFGVHRGSPATVLFSSADGAAWTADAPGALRGRPVGLAQKDGLTVLFTDPSTTGDDRAEPTAWRRKSGDGDWTASHEVSAGSLPDANVGLPKEQRIRRLTAWRGWFIATGSSADGGGVWLSQDGARWERVPVRENGFGDTESLRVFSNDDTVLVAGNTGSSGPVKVWRSS